MTKNTNRFFKSPIVILLLLIMITQSLLAQQSSNIDKNFDRLKILVNEKISSKNGVGAVVGIIEKDQVRSFVLGDASHNTNSSKLTNDSLFEVGSITKTFTALALADMVIDGTVKLNDPISQYLPEDVKIPQKNEHPITLLSLASHNSGLPRLPSNLDLNNVIDPYRSYDQQALYDFLGSYQPVRAVGEQREYSNLGFGLLGHILSLIDQKSYELVIRERVLKPLNMKHTYEMVPISEPFVDGHGDSLESISYWHFDALAGAGALRSSLSDMLIYLQANMMEQNQAIKLSHQVVTDFGNPTNNIGLAWITTKSANGDYIWHNGGTGGFRTFIGFNESTKNGIVMMANSTYALDDIARAYLTDTLQPMVKEINKPVVQLNKKQLDKLVGKYTLSPVFKLTVTKKEGSLFVKATGQGNHQVYASSTTEFYYKVVKATLKFTTDEQGNATAVTLFQNGRELTGQKQ